MGGGAVVGDPPPPICSPPVTPQGDSAEEVTRRVCALSPLEPALRSALCQRVQDEICKRQGAR